MALAVPVPAEAQSGHLNISGMAWRDFNDNGIRDPEEMNLGVANRPVELWTANLGTLLLTTTTNASGHYAIAYPVSGPNAYRLRIVLNSGFDLGPYRAGTNPLLDSDFLPTGPYARYTDVFVGVANLPMIGIDAGLNALDINVGNFTWVDLNGDGIQSAGEPGLAGIQVELWNAERTVRYHTTTSSQGGIYAAMAPGYGSFRLRYSLPQSAGFSPRQAGGNAQLDSDVFPTGPDAGWTDVLTFASNLISISTIDAGYVFSNPVNVRLEYANVPSLVFPGSSVSWTLWVRETINRPVTSARVRASSPSGLANHAWQCTPQGGASCAPSGTGSLDMTVALPAGSALRLDFSGQVMNGNFAQIIANASADITPPQTDVTPSDNIVQAVLRNDHLFANGFNP